MAQNKNWFRRVWYNIIWFFKELINLWSDKPSYFSKKRVESSTAFIIAQIGMIWFLISHIKKMDVYELAAWASIEFLIAGYTISQIQKEKKSNNGRKEEDIES